MIMYEVDKENFQMSEVDVKVTLDALRLDEHTKFFIKKYLLVEYFREYSAPNESYKRTEIHNRDELESFIIGLERAAAWKPEVKAKTRDELANDIIKEEARLIMDANINPSHYQGFVKELQWIETMQYIYQNQPDKFAGALEIMARKYMDRLGQKDPIIQELKKSIWYLKYLLAWEINDRQPIRVADVDNILNPKED